MKPYYKSGPVTLYHGDCTEVMRELPDESVHAVVTDPPYALEFMGKGWDKFTPAEFEAWCTEWAQECFRLLKPGGHLLAFGGSRTWHRLACGVEDAGFEIRDSIAWLYGSGFPKSLDVSKAIDAHLGADRPVVGTAKGAGNGSVVGLGEKPSMASEHPATAPATAWDGWGTALKPSFEPVAVARKPLVGTAAANVLEHGTGALNIDASRVGEEPREVFASDGTVVSSNGSMAGANTGRIATGRWPSNVVLDEPMAAALDEQTGVLKSGTMRAGTERQARAGGEIYGADSRTFTPADTYGDEGGASRFFPVFRYEAKAPTSERPRAGGGPASDREAARAHAVARAFGHTSGRGRAGSVRWLRDDARGRRCGGLLGHRDRA